MNWISFNTYCWELTIVSIALILIFTFFYKHQLTQNKVPFIFSGVGSLMLIWGIYNIYNYINEVAVYVIGFVFGLVFMPFMINLMKYYTRTNGTDITNNVISLCAMIITYLLVDNLIQYLSSLLILVAALVVVNIVICVLVWLFEDKESTSSVYTSLVNADDPTNPSVEKKDHIYTENYIKDSGLDYIFLRNSQYAEAMITNYFTYVKGDGILKNNQGDGLMAYISRQDCGKAAAYALASNDYHSAILNINGAEAMTISKFIEIGNEATGNNVSYQEITDEQNYAIFDAMDVSRTTDGKFKKDSEAPFSSDGMVTFGQAIREGKMSLKTNDFEKLTGDQPLTVKYMFEHSDDFQIGARHSQDK